MLTLAAVSWTAAIFFLPLAADPAKPSVGTAAIHGAGALICHQRPERSFHARDRQFPVCARCSGLYVAGTAGALAGWLGCARIPRRTRALLVTTAIPTAITVAAEWAGVAAPSNLIRAAAAVPLGGAVGWLFVRLLRAEPP